MTFPSSVIPIARPHGIGAPVLDEAQGHRFRLGATLSGQPLSLKFEPLDATQMADLMAHWQSNLLEGSFSLPAATVWCGRSSPPPVTLWRYARAPQFRRLPGGFWEADGIELIAMA